MSSSLSNSNHSGQPPMVPRMAPCPPERLSSWNQPQTLRATRTDPVAAAAAGGVPPAQGAPLNTNTTTTLEPLPHDPQPPSSQTPSILQESPLEQHITSSTSSSFLSDNHRAQLTELRVRARKHMEDVSVCISFLLLLLFSLLFGGGSLVWIQSHAILTRLVSFLPSSYYYYSRPFNYCPWNKSKPIWRLAKRLPTYWNQRRIPCPFCVGAITTFDRPRNDCACIGPNVWLCLDPIEPFCH